VRLVYCCPKAFLALNAKDNRICPFCSP
jgi:uncharacterized Zn-finger protein